MTDKRRKNRNRTPGQSVVEFALVLPLMLIILLAVVDFARIYTTMIGVESAAREAADFGTNFGAAQWSSANKDRTLADMETRACTAASTLTSYAGDDPDTDLDGDITCTNPGFAYCMTPPGGSCVPVESTVGCDNPNNVDPCTVTVTLTFDFHMLVPINVEVLGQHIGFPSTIRFDRDSTFAITDIDLAPTPTPLPTPIPTPSPSPTPGSTPTPEPTSEPTPGVTPTPESTPTPEPTPTPTPDPTPTPPPPDPTPTPLPDPTPTPPPPDPTPTPTPEQQP